MGEITGKQSGQRDVSSRQVHGNGFGLRFSESLNYMKLRLRHPIAEAVVKVYYAHLFADSRGLPFEIGS
jgi:hypothetical protein